MAKTTISMPDELKDTIDRNRADDEAFSKWMRGAARLKLEQQETESPGSRPEEGVA